MQIQAVVFDKDGVLVDSERLKAIAWHETLAPYDVKGFDWYLRNLGPSDVALAALAIQEFEIRADAQRIARDWNAEYRRREGQAEPIPGNVALLAALSCRYKIAVASSMAKVAIEAEMCRFGCMEHIDVCVSGEDVPRNKPAPDVYLAAARALGIDPSHCVAIEDSPTGVQAAKAAGMYCIGYQNPLYSLDLSQADERSVDLAAVSIFRS